MNKFPRGARPSPRHKLAAAIPFQPKAIRLPAQVAYIPTKMSMWLNDQYGDCVTAEEAFNQDVSGNFIEDSTVQTWASQGGFLNGADLTEVMDAMKKSGFSQSGNVYGDGGYTSVDYSSEPILQAAIAIAPVKIGIDANALPSGAGNGNGWYKTGGTPQEYTNEDHCVALCGYGPAVWLFQKLNTPLPQGVDGTEVMYLLFTWNSIGVVDHPWIMSTVGEAWLRNPSSVVNGVPLPNPGPVNPPVPPPPPPTPIPVPPTPTPNSGISVLEMVAIGVGALALGAGLTFLVMKLFR